VFLFFDDFGGNQLNTSKWGRSSTGVDVYDYVLRLEDWGDQEAFVEHGPGQNIQYLNERRIIEFRIKNASTWRGGVGLEGPGWGFKEMCMIFKDDGNYKFFADGTWGSKVVEGDKWYIGQIILYGTPKKRINVNFYYGNDNENYRQLVENVRDYEFGDWAPEAGGWYIDKYKPRVWDGGGTSSYYYDWFFVRKYAPAEPSVTVGSEESLPACTGTASIRLATGSPPSPPFLWGIRKVRVTTNLVVNQGDNLRLRFLGYDNRTVEWENVIWSRTTPGPESVVLTNLIVPHDNTLPYPSGNVKRVKLVLTDSAGNVILDNMAWEKVIQDDWGTRVSWIILNWGSHTAAEQNQLGSELTQIILNWAGTPSGRDRRDFSQA
jgi:hypothetical protein